LRYADFSARAEETPREIVKILGKDLPTEATALKDPIRDLKRAEFLARTEPEPSDVVGDLKREVFSAKPETEESEPPKDLRSEDFSAKPAFTVQDPLNDRSNDVCLTRVEVSIHAAFKTLKNKD
ncbi:MAG TPA: hypothetical protein VE177_01845, partial [Candidatus Binatus sp.]|nr:hypothetical protein [Candidatus Binatus sp.]